MRSIGPERTAEGARNRVPSGRGLAQISTAAGHAAKAYVDDLLKSGDEVIISTTKPDKYDRYLADVFIGQLKDGAKIQPPTGSNLQLSPFNSQLQEAGGFLNNALLENGHAVRYDGGAKEE